MTDALVGNGGPARQSRVNKINVRVFANLVEDKVVFTHDWSANNGEFQDPPIDLPRSNPDWSLAYRLYDFTGRGLQFPENADDAMWVKKSVKKECPTGKGNGGHVTFGTVNSTSPGGLRDCLTVSDDNRGPACTLYYMLRVETGQQKYIYDPEIKNGGTN